MPENELPTAEDLLKLSRRGMVCYTLRCAMRVADLTKPYPGLHKKVQACLKAAENICVANTDAAAYAAYAARSANADADAAYAADDAAAYAATNAAYAAADAAADAAYAAARADAAYNAAYAADDAARAAARAAAYAAADAMSDYQKLLERTGHQAGEFGDPIDPSENGPLGPLWPEEQAEDEGIENVKPLPMPTMELYFDGNSHFTDQDKILVIRCIERVYQEQCNDNTKRLEVVEGDSFTMIREVEHA